MMSARRFLYSSASATAQAIMTFVLSLALISMFFKLIRIVDIVLSGKFITLKNLRGGQARIGSFFFKEKWQQCKKKEDATGLVK